MHYISIVGVSAILSLINECVFEQGMMPFILSMKGAVCISGQDHTFKRCMFHLSQTESLYHIFINIFYKDQKKNKSTIFNQ